MQNLLFFFRFTFICNCCLVLAALSKFFPVLPEGFISSTVITLGVGLSFFINLLAAIILIILFVVKREMVSRFPKWLLLVNGLFLIPQLILLFR